ncbi:MAG: hypothetical protein IPG93_09475 [Burkholderiales bacterium]|nr:hypothetical protein [Burkholderiales bacterium]
MHHTSARSRTHWRHTPGLLAWLMGTSMGTLLGAIWPAHHAVAADAPQAAAAAASAPAEGVRKALFEPFTAAQDLVRARKFVEARAKLTEIEATPALSPYEAYQLDRLLFTTAVALNDGAAAQARYDRVVASGRLTEAELAPLLYNVMVAAYRAEDHARAAAAAVKVRAHPAMDADMRDQAQQIQIQSLYLGKDYVAAARELEADLATRRAAGKTPSEQSLRMLASSYNLTKATPSYFGVIEQLAVTHPKKDYWLELIGRVQSQPGFDDRLWLDLQRFKHAALGPGDANDYFESAEAAQQANLPVEARKLLDAGYAAGLLGQGAQAAEHNKLRATVARQVEEDAAVIDNAAAAARVSREPVALVHWGMSFVAAGKVDQGLALLEEALTKPTLKRPDDVRLRLGAAYAMADRKDQAVKTLQTVKGSDGASDIAHLWLLLLKLPAAR